jgi:hypothetical protein
MVRAFIFFKITLLFLFLLFSFEIYAGKNKVIWAIGKMDQSCDEFALAPDHYEDFVPGGFGSAGHYYVVGAFAPGKDFPYVLPGPFDEFAGYSYWSGRALNILPVYFDLKTLPETGTARLQIDLLEVSKKALPLFRCTVNGKKLDTWHFPQKELFNGGKLVLEMSSEPLIPDDQNR